MATLLPAQDTSSGCNFAVRIGVDLDNFLSTTRRVEKELCCHVNIPHLVRLLCNDNPLEQCIIFITTEVKDKINRQIEEQWVADMPNTIVRAIPRRYASESHSHYRQMLPAYSDEQMMAEMFIGVNQFDRFILFSNDKHFCRLLAELKYRYGKRVEVCSYRSVVSKFLVEECDIFHEIMDFEGAFDYPPQQTEELVTISQLLK